MKKIIIGILACSFVLNAFLLTLNSKYEKDLDRANANISALTDTLQNEAIAYQQEINQLWLQKKDLMAQVKANKNTKEIVKVKVAVKSTDTLLIEVPDTLLVRDLAVDTVLQDCWHYNHIIMRANEAGFWLSDSVTVQSELSYRVDVEKVLTKQYRTAFGRWLGRLTGHTVKVRKLYLMQRNPLIESDVTDFIQIID